MKFLLNWFDNQFRALLGLLFIKIAKCAFIIILQRLIEEKITAVLQQKDDTKRLNKRFTIEMNKHTAQMFHVATQQASLPAEQRASTPKLICQALSVEFGKIKTKPYIEATKSEIEISYPTEITNIIKAQRATARAQSRSSSIRAERQSITPEPTMRPSCSRIKPCIIKRNTSQRHDSG